jgi:hypothetical protein
MSANPGRLVRRVPKAARGIKAQRRAWARTTYRAGEAEGRIGRRSPALEALLARWGVRRGGFLTAWNPWGRRAARPVNAMLHRRLAGETRRLPRAEGWCGDEDWRELTLFLGVPPARLAALGRRYRQAAVVVVTRGQRLRLAYWPRFGKAPRSR